MSDPDQSGTSRGEAGSEQGTPAQDEAQSTAATSESGSASEGSQAGQSKAESKAGKSKTAESEAGESEAAESTSGSEPKSASAESTTGAGTSKTGSDSSASTQKLDTASASSVTSSEKPSGESTGTSSDKSDEAATTKVAQGSDESATSEQQAVDEDSGEQPKQKKSKAGVLLGLVSGAFVLLLALVLVAFFVWPGYAGPGSPDKEVDKTTAALASKDAGQLEQVSCHGPDGKPTAQIPPQAMQLIQEAKPAGAPQLVVDTEAHAPVDLTLSAQGQTQTLPSVAVMGVSDHQWCLKGLAQRQ